MASGTIYGTSYIDGHYRTEVEWSSTPNTANNTSTLYLSMYFWSDWAVNWTADKPCNVNVDDGKQGGNFTETANISHGTGATRTLYATGSYVITHNADGRRSVNLSGWIQPNVTISGYGTLSTMYWSGSVTLDTLASVQAKAMASYGWTGGYLSVWNGSAWVVPKNKWVWDGSSWKK